MLKIITTCTGGIYTVVAETDDEKEAKKMATEAWEITDIERGEKKRERKKGN